MVSIMQFWKKEPLMNRVACPKQALCYLLTALCLVSSLSVQGQNINIRQAESALVDDFYVLNASLDFDFNQAVLDALNDGVQLQINIQIRLERVRGWLWDPTVKEDTILVILERHPLADSYQITKLKTGEKTQYQNLNDALLSLSRIENYSLINRDILDPDSSYTGYIMATLEIETLPAPLRFVSSVSRQWQSQSNWYHWTLK